MAITQLGVIDIHPSQFLLIGKRKVDDWIKHLKLSK